MKLLTRAALGLPLIALLSGCDKKNSYDEHYTLAFVVVCAIVVLSLLLGKLTNLLRDEISDCDVFDANVAKMRRKTKRPVNKTKSPYSLAKTQFAAWTVVISCSYVYLSLCKGDCADGAISKTAIVLMGIGASIVTATAIMDKKEMQEGRPRHQNHPSQGFFVDLLSDDNGISLHRFQNFIWTAIAMLIYVVKVSYVKSGCVFPEISDTLLALTGISGATFITLRSSENKPSAAEAQNNSANDGPDTPPYIPDPVPVAPNPVPYTPSPVPVDPYVALVAPVVSPINPYVAPQNPIPATGQ